MTVATDDYESYAQAESTTRSTGAKVAIGCVAAALVVLLLTCIGGIVFAVWGFNKLGEFTEEYTAQGYRHVSSQSVTITEAITQPTVFTAQTVTIRAPVDADIAVMAQTLDVHDRVNGNIDAFAQVVTIHENAVVTGEFRAKAVQLLNVRGRLEGGITGKIQAVQRRDQDSSNGAADDSSDDAVLPSDPEEDRNDS